MIKIICAVVLLAVLLIPLSGCGSNCQTAKSEHPKSDHPTSELAKSDHPTSEHPKSDHPTSEHPK